MRALSSVGSRMRVSLELFFSLSALKYGMKERMRCWLEMLLHYQEHCLSCKTRIWTTTLTARSEIDETV